MATWDPSVYLAFADHRTRPFVELINAVDLGPEQVASIVDLGCGPGHLTQYLRRRWPDAQILGIDSSPEMIEQASTENDDPRASYAVEDVSTWLPPGPVDLIVSNAMFQWVDDQWNVLDRLLERLSPVGPSRSASPTTPRSTRTGRSMSWPVASRMRSTSLRRGGSSTWAPTNTCGSSPIADSG